MTEYEKEIETIELEVASGQSEPVRIDKYLAEMVRNATRSKVQQAIKEKRVKVNGEVVKASYIIQPEDKITAEVVRNKKPDVEAEDIPIDVVFEDEHFLIVNKPAGMVVHPAFGNWSGTLVNALLNHSENLSDYQQDVLRPGIVHRLDKDTSGLLVVAKNDHIHSELSKQFKKHSIGRKYWAIVWGTPPDSGTITGDLGRSKKDRKLMTVLEDGKGKRAVTHFKVIERFDFLALVEVSLETGRTHQIRVHFSHEGFPVLGDMTYGGSSVRYGSNTGFRKTLFEKIFKLLGRQCLHAKTLGFVHPATGEDVEFDSELPDDFSQVIDWLREYCT